MGWKRGKAPLEPFFKFTHEGQSIEGVLVDTKTINGRECYRFNIHVPAEIAGIVVLPNHKDLDGWLEQYNFGTYLRITLEKQIVVKNREKPMFAYAVDVLPGSK